MSLVFWGGRSKKFAAESKVVHRRDGENGELTQRILIFIFKIGYSEEINRRGLAKRRRERGVNAENFYLKKIWIEII